MSKQNYNVVQSTNKVIKLWTKHVPVQSGVYDQLRNVASMPFIFKHVAGMPDVHVGKGATVGSVIATTGAVIPAAVGVDIGCGMNALRLSIKASNLPESLKDIRNAIEDIVPVGFSVHNGSVLDRDSELSLHRKFKELCDKNDGLESMVKDPYAKISTQAGSLGGGNHFIELCIDENDDVWVMLHSGSRGIGNAIGRYFIEKAKEDMRVHHINLPDQDLAYLSEGTKYYDHYVEAVEWAQDYARRNREIMMELVLKVLSKHFKEFTVTQEAINCHHNYISREIHFGKDVIITRKGAVRAREGDLGIIPGSMGAKSYIVRGKGNCDSFHSCSHGAGRLMSRAEAKRTFNTVDHKKATEGVECRKDKGVIDETPMAYKDIDDVMRSQEDLVDIVHTLKQVMCIKG